MAEKLTDRTAKTSNFADGDLVHVVDVSDTSQDPAGSSFKSTIGNIYGSYLSPKITSAQIVTNAADTYSVTLADTVSSNHYLFLQTASGDPFVDVTVTSYAGPKDGAILVIRINKAGTDNLTIPGFSAGSGFSAGVYTARYSGSLASWLPVNYASISAPTVTDLQSAYDAGNVINGATFQIDNVTGKYIISSGTAIGGDINCFYGRNSGSSNGANLVVGIGDNSCQENIGGETIGIGVDSCKNNISNFVIGIGSQAAKQNVGTAVVAIGLLAAEANLGSDNIIGIGQNAARGNKGYEVIGIGQNATQEQIGNYVVGIGHNTSKLNEGNQVVGIGSYAAYENTAANVIALGFNAGYGNFLPNSFVISNSELPTYVDFTAASAAITTALGGATGSTYLYHDQTTNSIGAVRL